MTAQPGKVSTAGPLVVVDVKPALYAIADTCGFTLYESATYKGEWLGSASRSLEIGPFAMTTVTSAWSDEVHQYRSSFFVKLRKQLWAYVMWSKDEGLRMVLFDSHEVGISTDKAPTFGKRKTDETLPMVLPFAKAWFHHDHTRGWYPVKEAEF